MAKTKESHFSIPLKSILEFTVYSEYPKDIDPDYEDAQAYSVFIGDKMVARFGDNYHYKGEYKAEGFIVGFSTALGKIAKTNYEIKIVEDDEH